MYLSFLLETNAVFSKLGAEDIVSRYDKLLHEWKLMKDSELDFKRVMGLDHDRPLVRCLDCIPPGKNQFFIFFVHNYSGDQGVSLRFQTGGQLVLQLGKALPENFE